MQVIAAVFNVSTVRKLSNSMHLKEFFFVAKQLSKEFKTNIQFLLNIL